MATRKTTRKTTRKPASKSTTSRSTGTKRTTARKTTAKKSTARKTTAKKSTARKMTASKSTARKSMAKKSTSTARKMMPARKSTSMAKISSVKVGKKPMTKSEIFQNLSECTGLSKKEVSMVFDQFVMVIQGHMKGPGEFKWPGLMKIMKKRKPARKARKGINPFTGEEMMFKAKPASSTVKVSALKSLKEMV